MITTDELFAEPFIPEWMSRRQRLAAEHKAVVELELQRAALFEALSFNRALGPVVEEKFRAAATESRLRIATRCDRKGNYHNGAFRSTRKYHK